MRSKRDNRSKRWNLPNWIMWKVRTRKVTTILSSNCRIIKPVRSIYAATGFLTKIRCLSLTPISRITRIIPIIRFRRNLTTTINGKMTQTRCKLCSERESPSFIQAHLTISIILTNTRRVEKWRRNLLCLIHLFENLNINKMGQIHLWMILINN